MTVAEDTAKALETAATLERDALTKLHDAEASAKAALEAFRAAPTTALDQAVERAEVAMRTAQRFVDARSSARQRAEQAHAEALRDAEAEWRRVCVIERAGLRRELGAVFEKVVELSLAIDAQISAVEALVARDGELAAEIGDGASYPLDANVVRLALGHRLAREFTLPRAPDRGRVNMGGFDRALAVVEGLGDLEMQRAVFRAAHDELISIAGYEVADWLRVASPGEWSRSNLTGPAERSRKAESLLAEIEQQKESLS